MTTKDGNGTISSEELYEFLIGGFKTCFLPMIEVTGDVTPLDQIALWDGNNMPLDCS